MTNEILLMDVYYKPSRPGVYTTAYVNVYKSWDGSYWGESNWLDVCGPDRAVYTGSRERVAQIDGERLNSPARMLQE